MRDFVFRQGYPLVDDFQRLTASTAFQDMRAFSSQFQRRCDSALRAYRWVRDPFNQWSRQYEYPFVYDALYHFAAGLSQQSARVLDAGAGITFFPYYIQSRIPAISVECSDTDGSLWPIYEAVNQEMKTSIPFHATDLRHMSLPSGRFDIVYCISVLEHTSDYEMILRELWRILRPRGLLVLTFDVALEGPADISTSRAREFLRSTGKYFTASDGFDAERCIQSPPQERDILTTRYARRRDKTSLPFRNPWRQAFTTGVGGLIRHDVRPLLSFVATLNHLTCFCLTAARAEQV